MNAITLTLIVSQLILAGFAGFVFSYTKKRGENIATKHDLKSINDKIEEIKLEYSKKLEEYKSELSKKYEIEKILIENKIEVFKKLIQLKSLIIKRKNNLVPENESIEAMFGLMIEISIQISSISVFNQSIKDMAIILSEENNKFVGYILKLREKGETRFEWNFDPVVNIIDTLQIEIIK